MPEKEKNRSILTVGGVALFLFLVPMLRVGEFKVPLFWDDISIVFVYALNLLNNGEIFYNEPGDRIDGFTSMMDVLFVIPLALIDADNLFRLNYYAKALLTAAVPVGVLLTLLSWRIRMLPAAAVALAVASSETLAHGFGMQLEAPLYALLMTAFFAVLTGTARARPVLLAALGFILYLTRPEALVLVAVAFAAFLLLLRGDERFRATLYAAAGATLLIAGWIGWRISFFGYWAPNTYYAKMSGARLEEITDGLGYVSSHLMRAPEAFLYLALLLLIATLFTTVWRRNQDDRVYYFGVCAAVAVAMLFVRIVTGGDSYWMSSRLMMDTLLPAALATGLGLTVISARYVRNGAVCCVMVALVLSGFFIARQLPGNVLGFVRMERFAHRAHNCEKAAMRELAGAYPNATLAHTDFQRAKYYAPELRILDLSGLNNREIAHGETGDVNTFGKHDLGYGLSRQADLLKFGTGVREFDPLSEAQWLNAMNPDNEAVRQLREVQGFLVERAPELMRDYTPLAVPTNCGDYINLIARRDLVESK